MVMAIGQLWRGLIFTDAATLGRVIQNYARVGKLVSGKQLHCQLIVSRYTRDTFTNNNLINMYSKCGEMGYALKLFDKMTQRNGVSWTAVIAGLCQNFRFWDALNAFYEMWVAGESLNQFVFSSVVKACSGLGWICFGKQVHCLAVKYGFCSELYVGSNLADMYSGYGEMIDALRIFEAMPSKDEVCWTAMVDGYSKNGDFSEALIVFKKMGCEGVLVDQHALSSALGACGGLKACCCGMSLHAAVVKSGHELDIIVGNALIDMYVKIGEMDYASKVYDFQPDSNIISCTSLIDGYVESNQVEKAFRVFTSLRMQNLHPNEFTFSCLIKASTNQAALDLGTQLHAKVLKTDFVLDPFVSAVLLDMYGKCGLIDDAIQVFYEIEKPTEFTWNSLLNVFGQHGLGDEVIRTFELMTSNGVTPNDVTFVSLLTGCSHSGLVDKGLNYFYSMGSKYGIVPKTEHYSCVIHLLGRAGKLNEAEQFIKSMPFQPNAHGWCSFLWACKTHGGDSKRGKIAADSLLQLEPENSGVHILLSNIYAMNHQWESARTIRKSMKDDNVRKLPGYSWIEFGNQIHVFGAANWSHPRQKDIYKKLDSLLDQIKAAGYVPITDSVSVQIDNDMKEISLQHHSERIAIAFALLSMPPGKLIIVKKNLRVCVDCHSAIKLISQVVGRKIIVRDNSRFHHFEDGCCSCRDYW